MHPAYSVIFFTVSSGAGYGLLMWLAIGNMMGLWQPVGASHTTGLVALVLGSLLVIAGLLSSTFHLGHPERAWRAFSQWRTSWLSREGVLAVLSFIPIVVLTAGWIFTPQNKLLLFLASVLLVILALNTVYSTAMIYASLKPIPAWHNAKVPPVYMAFMFASGALLALFIYSLGAHVAWQLVLFIGVVLLSAWQIKMSYWRFLDHAPATSTVASATGFAADASINVLETPHTSENYLQKEMGFAVARKHATKLRRIAVFGGSMAPGFFLAGAMITEGIIQSIFLFCAAALLIGCLLIERWLFFAEAKHAVTLFYGQKGV